MQYRLDELYISGGHTMSMACQLTKCWCLCIRPDGGAHFVSFGNLSYCIYVRIMCWNTQLCRFHFSTGLRLREILLSFQIGFSLVNAAVVCAVLESSSGLETHQL